MANPSLPNALHVCNTCIHDMSDMCTHGYAFNKSMANSYHNANVAYRTLQRKLPIAPFNSKLEK